MGTKDINSRKLNMIYLISRARVSGPVNQGLNILNGMKINGRINSSLVTISPEIATNSWLYKFKDDEISTFSLNTPLWKIFFCINKFKKFLNDNNIDIIHSSGFRANFISVLMPKKFFKISTQRCSPQDIGEKFPPILRGFLSYLYIKLIKKINVNVACSKSLRDIYQKKYNMAIPFVQNGVNTEMFHPVNEEKKKQLRAELDIQIGKKTFIILGSLRSRKNNELAINVINELRDIDAQFLIVGDGPERNKLEHLAQNPNIKFIGHTPNPLKYLQASDILISCSLAEGLPNTVLESLSCGIPCILSNIDPHRELIDNTEAGIIFDLKDRKSLKNAILSALNWDVSKQHVSRHLAISRFDRKVIANNYEAIYRKNLE